MVLEKYYPIIGNSILIISITLVCVALIIWAFWYFFVVMKRKKWHLDIYEQKSDGKLHLVGKDVLEERRYDNGRRVMYWLKRYKSEATPPPIEATDRVAGKDFADYLKIRQNFVPMVKEIPAPTDLSSESTTPEKKRTVMGALSALLFLGRKDKYKGLDDIRQRFVYVPVTKVPHVDVQYMQMDYDVDIMRINAIDNIDKFFSDKATFWQKYKELIIILLGVVMVIVVGYLSFEYGKAVITEGISASRANAQEIRDTNSALRQVANALGAKVPEPVPAPDNTPAG